jgi:hypothetical protein
MKTKPDDAFLDAPPTLADGTQPRALDTVVFSLMQSAGGRIGDDSNPTWCGLYLIAATKPPAEAAKLLNSADALIHAQTACLELSGDDFDSVLAYMLRVIERRSAAQIEVEETPGKQQGESQATTPETPPEPLT